MTTGSQRPPSIGERSSFHRSSYSEGSRSVSSDPPSPKSSRQSLPGAWPTQRQSARDRKGQEIRRRRVSGPVLFGEVFGPALGSFGFRICMTGLTSPVMPYSLTAIVIRWDRRARSRQTVFGELPDFTRSSLNAAISFSWICGRLRFEIGHRFRALARFVSRRSCFLCGRISEIYLSRTSERFVFSDSIRETKTPRPISDSTVTAHVTASPCVSNVREMRGKPFFSIDASQSPDRLQKQAILFPLKVIFSNRKSSSFGIIPARSRQIQL